MDYIGSKEKLNEWMFRHIVARCGDPTDKVFCDACAGAGSVSRYAASLGFTVVACDALSFSQHTISGTISEDDGLWAKADHHIGVMNKLSGAEGYFFQNFSPYSDRMYFTEDNAKKIDACRSYLRDIEKQNSKLFSVLIYSLLQAISRVSNTAGTYGAFLKKFKARALSDLKLRDEVRISGRCEAYQANIVDFLCGQRYYDVVYIDPPYNERQYAPNYHIYESVTLDSNLEVAGITGLFDWSIYKSEFCQKECFLPFLKRILQVANTPVVFMSYSTDGISNRDDIEECLFREGFCDDLSVHSLPQRRYKADCRRQYKDGLLRELLFEISLQPNDRKVADKRCVC